MFDYSARLQRVQQAMGAAGLDLIFLNLAANLQYLTGIAREEPNYGNTMYPGEWLTGAWIPQQGAPILTLPRMLADFHLGHLPGYDVRVLPDAGDPAQLAAEVLRALKIQGDARVAVEDRAWAELVLNLQRLLPNAQLSPASAILAPLRRIKDAEEIEVMRQAGAITVAAYAATLPRLRHGMTTLDLITEVNYQLRSHGARTHSFVTSFYNMGTNFPFDFTNREEMLLLPLEPPISISYDFGAVYGGYCYDFGRSVFFGEPDAEYRRVYALVMASQAAGHPRLACWRHLRGRRRRGTPGDRRGRLRPRLPPPAGPRHRHGRPRGALPHQRRRHGAGAGHVLHRGAEHLHAAPVGRAGGGCGGGGRGRWGAVDRGVSRVDRCQLNQDPQRDHSEK